jgi:hypothetical protein
MLREIYPNNENILKIYGLACEQSEYLEELEGMIDALSNINKNKERELGAALVFKEIAKDTKGTIADLGAKIEKRDDILDELEQNLIVAQDQNHYYNLMRKYRDRCVEVEKELKSALYFNIDVVRCLSKIAWEHNHDEIPAYMELSKKCIGIIESKDFEALKEKGQ